MVVMKNVSRFSKHVRQIVGAFQPSIAGQYILIYVAILGVSKDCDLQLYGQKYT